MRALQRFAKHFATVFVITASSSFFYGQDSSARTQAAPMAVSITMRQQSISAGQEPWVTLTEKIIGNRVMYEGNDFPFRIHVEGDKGEPPRTYYHRQLRQEPGVPSLAGGGPVPFEARSSGELIVKKFDLAKYYDLSMPGKYTVDLEVQDGSGVWLRTNTVHFEILEPAQ